MEFLGLLLVTLVMASVVALAVIAFFRKPIDKIFARIIGEDISIAWRKFLTFALFVVGVANGAAPWRLEQFIRTPAPDEIRPVLTAEYWGLEVYRTIIETLGGMAWALLLFFVVALIAFVMVRRKEVKA